MDTIEENLKDGSVLNYHEPSDGGFAFDDPQIQIQRLFAAFLPRFLMSKKIQKK